MQCVDDDDGCGNGGMKTMERVHAYYHDRDVDEEKAATKK